MSEGHGLESRFTEDRRDPDGHVLRAFLVACHEADVSVENMSRYLGIEEHAVRAELLIALGKWRAAHAHEDEVLMVGEIRGSAVSPA
jgi:hypothetical protein